MLQGVRGMPAGTILRLPFGSMQPGTNIATPLRYPVGRATHFSLHDYMPTAQDPNINGKSNQTEACPYCFHVFNGRNRHQNLAIHLRIHTGETPYPCPLCPYQAKRKSHLHLHMSRKHSAPSPDVNRMQRPVPDETSQMFSQANQLLIENKSFNDDAVGINAPDISCSQISPSNVEISFRNSTNSLNESPVTQGTSG